jgi:tetratricopeptide (TPR) repeat protein
MQSSHSTSSYNAKDLVLLYQLLNQELPLQMVPNLANLINYIKMDYIQYLNDALVNKEHPKKIFYKSKGFLASRLLFLQEQGFFINLKNQTVKLIIDDIKTGGKHLPSIVTPELIPRFFDILKNTLINPFKLYLDSIELFQKIQIIETQLLTHIGSNLLSSHIRIMQADYNTAEKLLRMHFLNLKKITTDSHHREQAMLLEEKAICQSRKRNNAIMIHDDCKLAAAHIRNIINKSPEDTNRLYDQAAALNDCGVNFYESNNFEEALEAFNACLNQIKDDNLDQSKPLVVQIKTNALLAIQKHAKKMLLENLFAKASDTCTQGLIVIQGMRPSDVDENINKIFYFLRTTIATAYYKAGANLDAINPFEAIIQFHNLMVLYRQFSQPLALIDQNLIAQTKENLKISLGKLKYTKRSSYPELIKSIEDNLPHETDPSLIHAYLKALTTIKLKTASVMDNPESALKSIMSVDVAIEPDNDTLNLLQHAYLAAFDKLKTNNYHNFTPDLKIIIKAALSKFYLIPITSRPGKPRMAELTQLTLAFLEKFIDEIIYAYAPQINSFFNQSLPAIARLLLNNKSNDVLLMVERDITEFIRCNPDHPNSLLIQHTCILNIISELLFLRYYDDRYQNRFRMPPQPGTETRLTRT